MRLTRHGPALTQLSRLGSVNCFFVHEEDGLTLIDTGLPGSASDILGAAESLGRPIRRILLTHAHWDHAGSVDRLLESIPEAEFMLTSREARLLAGNMSLDRAEPQVPVKGRYLRCASNPTRLLGDGDQVGSLQVVEAPGHTPGQAAFLDLRNGSLIAGDAFITVGGVLVAGIPRFRFPFPALGTWHLPTTVDSARRLAGLQPTRLAVGHGPVVDDPRAEFKTALEQAEVKLERTRAG